MNDKNGRPAQAGDIIKVYHYMDHRPRRRHCYMYKLLVMSPDGKDLYCVDIVDIARTCSLAGAHKCSIECVGEFEIIDGPSSMIDGYQQTWYERPKTAQPDEVDA